jgi:hypothetical protein
MANQAAWIKQKQAQVIVDAADQYEPGAGELLVKVDVIGFSPIEAKTQKHASVLCSADKCDGNTESNDDSGSPFIPSHILTSSAFPTQAQ